MTEVSDDPRESRPEPTNATVASPAADQDLTGVPVHVQKESLQSGIAIHKKDNGGLGTGRRKKPTVTVFIDPPAGP